MIFLKENMKYLRKLNGLTQGELAEKLDIKRSLIGSYEEGRGVPKLTVIKQMADFFNISTDFLLTHNLEQEHWTESQNIQPKILSVVVTPDNEELISIVPVKASAGYLTGRANTEYMEQLPHFAMPVSELSQGRSYRVFQTKGDSMLPIPPGAYIFCDYVEHFTGIREGKSYILITADEGIVFKRVYFQNETHLLLKSDNPEYAPYSLEMSSVLEIWKALGFLSFELPEPNAPHVQKLTSMVAKLQDEVQRLKD
jgi:transcriptional regulator with XRE-family HTH domain